MDEKDQEVGDGEDVSMSSLPWQERRVRRWAVGKARDESKSPVSPVP